jgi:hypothetical protein
MPAGHGSRARVAAAVLGLIVMLAVLFTLVPEALGDHPFDVF